MPSKQKKLCWVKPAPVESRSEIMPNKNGFSTPINDKQFHREPVSNKNNPMYSNGFVGMPESDMRSSSTEPNALNEKEGNGKKKETSLKVLANETSAHGIKNVLSGHRFRRVSWFLAVTAAMIFLTYNLVTVFLDYVNYPFQTTFKLTPKSEITFPAVTICPLNQLDSSKVKHSAELEHTLRIFSEGFFKETGSVDDVKNLYPYNEILQWNYWDLMKNATPSIEDTFVSCQWQKEDLDCSTYMTYINTPTGRCYQFNIHENNTLKALRPGSRGGFSAVLHLSQDGYTVSERHAAGFKILLHDQYDYPDVFSRGQFFGPGFSYDVSFRKEQFNFLPDPYKAYENAFCSDEYPANYTGFTEAYSMKSCIHHQDSLLTSRRCGCVEHECTVQQYLECYKPLFQQYYDDVTTIENVFDCAFACNFAGFLVGVSSVLFPANKAMTRIASQLNVSQATFRESYLELNLYFEDLLVRESVHVPVYGNWFNIMAMLGGNMGLFLGASLLTMVELIEVVLFMFLTLFLKLPCCRKRQSNDNLSDIDVKEVYLK